MNHPDEPIRNTGDADEGPSEVVNLSVQTQIQRLVDEQPYGVLCVQGGGQPYGALVAFAFSADLGHAVFATPVATRKYRLLSQCNHVALVIDNRRDKADELMEIEAVTATGRAHEIERGAEYDHWAELLVTRHAYLKSFVTADTCALFRVDLVRFLHVVRFQEVSQWIPTADS
jgi:nitroimidazol reductase NimA-like FMN-containing flavoprotein (pyridoxamine 5'-phosphate oxidase superfamily)